MPTPPIGLQEHPGGHWTALQDPGSTLRDLQLDHSTSPLESLELGLRRLLGSLVQMGFPLGMLTATLAFNTVSDLPETEFMGWGWRLPSLASVLLIGAGLFVRLKLVETPEFERVIESAEIARAPVIEILRNDWRRLLISAGLKTSESAWIYILTVFSVFYTADQLGIPKTYILDSIFVGALVELVLIPVFGAISDHLGRRALFIGGATFSIIFAFLIFHFLQTGNQTIILLAVTVGMSLCHGSMFAPQAAFFPELFKTNVRYSAASPGFQLAAAFSGGLAPLIATSLLAWEHGGTTAISLYLVTLSIVTLVAAISSHETAFTDK